MNHTKTLGMLSINDRHILIEKIKNNFFYRTFLPEKHSSSNEGIILTPVP